MWLGCGLVLLVACLAAAQKDPNVWDNRSAIVHLFEWKFDDIASECEQFLAPSGYAAVQLSPINEVIKPNTTSRSWSERYQPISYNIMSRSGDEDSFRSMLSRCNRVGIRIYVDVVLNHMTANWGLTVGTGGGVADTDSFTYPGVPYGPQDFHQPTCGISDEDYTVNANNVRNCELTGLHDLNQGSAYVRSVMLDFLNKLVNAGVAGFRIDAAKHMWPADLSYIYSNLNDLNTDFGFAPASRPLLYQEVIDYGTEAVKKAEYSGMGRVTEFSYGSFLGQAFSGQFDISHLYNFGPDWGMLDDEDALVFIDNHDNQRGSGGGSNNVLTYKQSKLYKMSVAFMLSWPFGYPRVMSSYYFTDVNQGPPDDSDQNIVSPIINPDGSCGGGWVCEHRWEAIKNMVTFRNDVKDTSVNNWWDNGKQLIAFCRGNSGFIAFNGQYQTDFKQTLQTCVPAGTYCDLITGHKNGSSCTGKTVTVNADGTADIVINATEDDGVLAISTSSKL